MSGAGRISESCRSSVISRDGFVVPVIVASSCPTTSAVRTYHYASKCETAGQIDKGSGDGSWQEAYDRSEAWARTMASDKGA